MRGLIIILMAVLSTVNVLAQAPQQMSYQAVVRNSSGQLVVNSPVGLQISILQGSATGSPVFTETHQVNTNENGLITVEIGGGTITLYTVINWSSGSYFLKTEIDPAGGSNYTIEGTSQLLSVPYAMYADKAGNVPQNIDTSNTNEIQFLTIFGNDISISNGNTISLPSGFSGNYNDLLNKPDFSVYDNHISNQNIHTTTTEKNNWNSAYNWGNHANAGYIVAPTGQAGANTYLKNDGSGNISWATVATTDKVYNVINYGAFDDGTHDAITTSAVQSAITALLVAGRGVLYFPAGIYTLNSKITINLGTTGSINIRGDGPGISRVSWSSGTDGFEINFSPEGGYDGDKRCVIVQELSLLTAGSGAGSAIKFVNSGSSAPAPVKQVKNVVTAGATTANYWGYGVRLSGCSFTNIISLQYQGNPSAPGGTAILLEGTNDPVDNFISNLRIFHAENGVEITGNNEGVYIDQSVMLFVKKGINWHTSSHEPLLSITGCHINASECCIYGENLIQGIISNNLLYQNTNYSSNWIGIKLTGASAALTDFIQISHNTIHGWKSTTGNSVNGILVENKSKSIIQGNIIHDVDTGIWLLPSSDSCFILDNFVQNYLAFPVYNQGTNNIVRSLP